MSVFLAIGSKSAELSRDETRDALFRVLEGLGERRRVLAVPPDMSRLHSGSGPLLDIIAKFYGERLRDVLPALGTHRAMTDGEIAAMYGGVPRGIFRVHDWRRDVVTLGEVPGEFLREVSEGALSYTWPAEVNRLLRDGGHGCSARSGGICQRQQEYLDRHGRPGGHQSVAFLRCGLRDGAHDGASGYAGAAGAE